MAYVVTKWRNIRGEIMRFGDKVVVVDMLSALVDRKVDPDLFLNPNEINSEIKYIQYLGAMAILILHSNSNCWNFCKVRTIPMKALPSIMMIMDQNCFKLIEDPEVVPQLMRPKTISIFP